MSEQEQPVSETPLGTVEVSLTAQDLVRAMQLNSANLYSTRLQRISRVILAALAVALAVMLATGVLPAHGNTLLAMLGVVVILATPFIINGLINPLAGRRAFRRDPRLREPQVWTWFDDRLTVGGRTGETRLAWRELPGWSENAEILLFYVGPNLFHMLPKRDLDESQQRQLQGLLAKVPRRGRR